jgi:hypothetical protein
MTTIQIDVPNLDDGGVGIEYARELRQLSRDLTKLARYCCFKANAMQGRLKGHISLALLDEAECERIYNTLPPDWRW